MSIFVLKVSIFTIIINNKYTFIARHCHCKMFHGAQTKIKHDTIQRIKKYFKKMYKGNKN